MKLNFKILIIIILLIFIIFSILNYLKINFIENFEDKFDDHETYDEIYDDEFVNLYEIIYRDFSDIDIDTRLVYSKVIDSNMDKPNINFLVCGSGVGKLCKKIKEKYNVIGVDISSHLEIRGEAIFKF